MEETKGLRKLTKSIRIWLALYIIFLSATFLINLLAYTGPGIREKVPFAQPLISDPWNAFCNWKEEAKPTLHRKGKKTARVSAKSIILSRRFSFDLRDAYRSSYLLFIFKDKVSGISWVSVRINRSTEIWIDDEIFINLDHVETVFC